MKTVIDLPPDLIERLGKAAKAQGLPTISHYVRLALENQLVLEENAGEAYDLDALLEPAGFPSTKAPKTVIMHARATAAAPRADADPWALLRIADGLGGVPVGTPPTVIDEPLWGQCNRLFPTKVGLRALAFLERDGQTVSLQDFHAFASRTATSARKVLEALDERNQVPRGERLSAAFPDDNDKSRERFIAHFLGDVQRNGKAVGALPELALIAIGPGSAVRFTAAGREFAALANPVIDGADIVGDSLTTDEVEWLLRHIRATLPSEHELLLNIATWIQEGEDTPDALRARISTHYPAWTDKKVDTMRGGALGRMHDLMLIARDRTGVQVQYKLRPRGVELVKEGA